LADAVELLSLFKQAALQAIEASKPVKVCFGKVISITPLEIAVEQKLFLKKKQLILTRNVTDFQMEMTVEDWETERETRESEGITVPFHSHKITGKKKITFHSGLAVGDKVVLLREQGGQKYLILGRTE